MATGAPGTNGVWQYGEDDSEATFSALLNKVASTTDTQIGTDRGRLTTLEAKPLSALVPIVPGSVSVASPGSYSTSTNGQVTFTNAPAISLNNIFSSAYTNYRILLTVTNTTTTNEVTGRMRRSAVGDTTTNYYQGGNYSTSGGTSTAWAVNNGSYMRFVSTESSAAAGRTEMAIEIHNPVATNNTGWHGVGSMSSGTTGPAGVFAGGMIVDNLSYDSITLLITTGNVSGFISVYGYNK